MSDLRQRYDNIEITDDMRDFYAPRLKLLRQKIAQRRPDMLPMKDVAEKLGLSRWHVKCIVDRCNLVTGRSKIEKNGRTYGVITVSLSDVEKERGRIETRKKAKPILEHEKPPAHLVSVNDLYIEIGCRLNTLSQWCRREVIKGIKYRVKRPDKRAARYEWFVDRKEAIEALQFAIRRMRAGHGGRIKRDPNVPETELIKEIWR